MIGNSMTQDRRTFTVPDGFEAVRDEEGRATGEVRPTQPTTQAIQQVRAFAVIDPHWGEPRIMLHTIRQTREEVLKDALWDRELSLYSAAVLDRQPPIKGQWERLERQGFKIEEVSIEALSVSASEREALEARVKDMEVDNSRLNYALFHTDFAAIGLTQPDDGTSVCIGTNSEKLAAAKRLRERGLVTITDHAQGPLVARAALNGAKP